MTRIGQLESVAGVMTKSDGGQAFPVSELLDNNGCRMSGAIGMSLRDWFAGMLAPHMVKLALNQEICIADEPNALLSDVVAHNSYAIADSLLKERNKPIT